MHGILPAHTIHKHTVHCWTFTELNYSGVRAGSRLP